MIASRMFPVLAVAVLAVACGGGGGGDNGGSVTQTDDELARSMLLTVADFPPGWGEVPSDRREQSPADECDPGDAEGRTGRAETGEFSRGTEASVSETVAIFETPQQVEAAMARFSDVGDCVIGVVESGDLDTDEMDFQGASFGPINFREFGDKTNVYRMQLSFTSTQGTGAGSAGDIFYDLVFVASGRTGFSVYAIDVETPFDPQELEEIVSKALARVEDLSP